MMPFDIENTMPRQRTAALPFGSDGAELASVGAAGPLGGRRKRFLDIAFVLACLPFVAILMLGLSLLIKASSPGPVFYGHRRVGFGGAEFRCWKFRTMVTNGDVVLEQHFQRNPADRILWKSERKLADDPRVTPIGAVLRKLSLDELPQLLNILAGDMSIVGPRPVVREELDNYGQAAPFYLATRPGLTGLWQISGRSDTSYAERVRLDRKYASGWSIIGDLGIILRTVPALLTARGAR
ncbi:sugar transferase [Paracoccus ravus]|uniref:sugar transferase n=1 Tax=Paracoccus ravus TaxID=2447760 RepID=UPI002468A2E7|nr:sugar transferase [Paracoccus ravus]